VDHSTLELQAIATHFRKDVAILFFERDNSPLLVFSRGAIPRELWCNSPLLAFRKEVQFPSNLGLLAETEPLSAHCQHKYPEKKRGKKKGKKRRKKEK
jgi:hypothetical protein